MVGIPTSSSFRLYFFGNNSVFRHNLHAPFFEVLDSIIAGHFKQVEHDSFCTLVDILSSSDRKTLESWAICWICSRSYPLNVLQCPFFRMSLPLSRQAMGSSSLQRLPFQLNRSQTTYQPLGCLSTLYPPLIVRFREWWGKRNNYPSNLLSSKQLFPHFTCSLLHGLSI